MVFVVGCVYVLLHTYIYKRAYLVVAPNAPCVKPSAPLVSVDVLLTLKNIHHTHCLQMCWSRRHFKLHPQKYKIFQLYTICKMLLPQDKRKKKTFSDSHIKYCLPFSKRHPCQWHSWNTVMSWIPGRRGCFHPYGNMTIAVNHHSRKFTIWLHIMILISLTTPFPCEI